MAPTQTHRSSLAKNRSKGPCLELLGGFLDPGIRGPVVPQGLLSHHGPQVEQHGRLLVVDAGLLQGAGGAEGVEPLEGDVHVLALLADGEPRLHHAQPAVVPAGSRLCNAVITSV